MEDVCAARGEGDQTNSHEEGGGGNDCIVCCSLLALLSSFFLERQADKTIFSAAHLSAGVGYDAIGQECRLRRNRAG